MSNIKYEWKRRESRIYPDGHSEKIESWSVLRMDTKKSPRVIGLKTALEWLPIIISFIQVL